MITRDVANKLYFSRDAIQKAEEPKELFIVDGQSHVGLYDTTSVSLPKLIKFMDTHLCKRVELGSQVITNNQLQNYTCLARMHNSQKLMS